MQSWDKKSGVDQKKAEKAEGGFKKAGSSDVLGNLKSAWLNMKSAFESKDNKLTDKQKEQR
jgi:hypothetical protein